MIQDMEDRRKWKHQSTEMAQKEYRRLNNKLRRSTEKAREKWWEEQCRDIEELQKIGRHDKVYEKVKKITKRATTGRGIAVEDEEGKLLQDANEVRRRWKEYVEDLYQSKDRPTEIMEDSYMGDGEDLGPKVLREEVLAAINELKNNKAEGIDNIPA